MPVSSDEVYAVECEEATIRYLAAPLRIVVDDGHVSSVETMRMVLGPKGVNSGCLGF